MFSILEKKVMQVTPNTFEDLALEVFRFQAKENLIFHKYLQLLKIKVADINNISQIPFLPVSCFKHHKIKCGDWNEETIFYSSGTTGMIKSKHLVKSLAWYENVILKDFNVAFNNSSNYQFFGLLPGYVDNPNSSLICMIHLLMKKNKQNAGNYFYKDDFQKLFVDLTHAVQSQQQVILFGVSFALYDFAKQYALNAPNLNIIETGGLKSSKRQFTKIEIIETLNKSFPSSKIYSEYGMTEMMSQAYSPNGIHYNRSTTMDVIISAPDDHKEIMKVNRRGRVNIIDLGNVHTCSFIQTGDLGIKLNASQFQILGRLDDEEIRGCNMLLE